MDWRTKYAATRCTAAEAVQLIPPGKHLFIGSGAAEPAGLVEELVAQHQRFADNSILHLLTLGPAPYVEPLYERAFRHNAVFIGPNVRAAVNEGRADYTPVFLSQIPGLMRMRRLPVDVALIQVTPPDPFGFVNLGVSVDIVLAAVQCAKTVIAEINPHMPLVHGAGFIPMERINAWVERPMPLPQFPREPLDEAAREIGHHVAGLVDDGCTIQVGIGQIPDAVAAALTHKKDLGVWTEMFPEGLVDLIANGNVTGLHKTVEPCKVTASFSFGSQRTYDYLHGNPTFSFQPSDYVNDPVMVARQHRMVAINGALQIDLTGQVCSDSIGYRFYSGIGGQVDFIRGARMCPGGKPIIAIRSTAVGGKVSKVVATLDEGAGVVTSRGDVSYVVTEYGVADLQGKSVRERAMALISVAHPDFRAELLAAAKKRRYVFAKQIAPAASVAGHFEKRFEAKDGRQFLLRPIRATDEGKTNDLFYNLSAKDRQWMTPLGRMSERELQQYLDTSDPLHMAVIIESLTQDREPELLGMGRYHGDPATRIGHIAFVIRDDHQGLGLGTALLQHLIEVARASRLVGFAAAVPASSHTMLHVLHKSGLTINSRLTGDTYHLELPFAPPLEPLAV